MDYCDECKKKYGAGGNNATELVNKLCGHTLINCQVLKPPGQKCSLLNPETVVNCQLYKMILKVQGALIKRLEEADYKNKVTIINSRGGPWNSITRWCCWIAVTYNGKKNRGRRYHSGCRMDCADQGCDMDVEYLIDFRLDDYVKQHSFKKGCLFGASGNMHDIKNVGYIQFVETRNFYDTCATAAFKTLNNNGELVWEFPAKKANSDDWEYPDNKYPQRPGRVCPLSFYEDAINVLGFFECKLPAQSECARECPECGRNNTNPNTLIPCPIQVDELRASFIGWITKIEDKIPHTAEEEAQ
jgi:hypothetical protein